MPRWGRSRRSAHQDCYGSSGTGSSSRCGSGPGCGEEWRAGRSALLRRGLCMRVGQAPLRGSAHGALNLQWPFLTSCIPKSSAASACSRVLTVLLPPARLHCCCAPRYNRWLQQSGPECAGASSLQFAACACAALWKGAPSSCALGLTPVLPPCSKIQALSFLGDKKRKRPAAVLHDPRSGPPPRRGHGAGWR
jgi:hypothetical protein